MYNYPIVKQKHYPYKPMFPSCFKGCNPYKVGPTEL